MGADDSFSFRVNEAVCDNRHVAFFERCFMDEYKDIMEERGGVETFANDIRNTVVPAILAGADDQTNMEIYESGKICGTVSFAKRGTTAYVWGLYVDPDCQRRQIGTRLMREICRAVGGMTVLSIQVMVDSTKAQMFYRKCGFQILTSLLSEVFPEVMRNVNVMEVDARTCLQNIGAPEAPHDPEELQLEKK